MCLCSNPAFCTVNNQRVRHPSSLRSELHHDKEVNCSKTALEWSGTPSHNGYFKQTGFPFARWGRNANWPKAKHSDRVYKWTKRDSTINLRPASNEASNRNKSKSSLEFHVSHIVQSFAIRIQTQRSLQMNEQESLRFITLPNIWMRISAEFSFEVGHHPYSLRISGSFAKFSSRPPGLRCILTTAIKKAAFRLAQGAPHAAVFRKGNQLRKKEEGSQRKSQRLSTATPDWHFPGHQCKENENAISSQSREPS